MVNKCCVPSCKSNYKYKDNGLVSVFRFPQDEDERIKWLTAIPRDDLCVTKNTVVCQLHWPENAPYATIYGKRRPINPPSIFNIHESCFSNTVAAIPRSTTKNLTSVILVKKEQIVIPMVNEIDSLEYSSLCTEVSQRYPNLFAFETENQTVIQSKEMIIQNGIPKFVIKIEDDLSYSCFLCGAPWEIPSLSRKRIERCEYWSIFDEMYKYLSNKEPDHKLNILLEDLASEDAGTSDERIYSPNVIIRAFEYYAQSSELYSLLTKDYHLPSIKTLHRITSKFSKIDDENFLTSVLQSAEMEQKRCVVLWDKMYIKAAMTYHREKVFGKAVDQENELAESVLCVMIKLFEGPDHIYKALPIKNLTHEFLCNIAKNLIQAMSTNKESEILAFIADGNRVNQLCFDTLSTKTIPWKIKGSNIYLLYDYIHVMMCIRNNWLTECTQELNFNFQGVTQTARWSDLKMLLKFELETDPLKRVSKLDNVSIYPKPTERQNVETCLRVFCDETIAALETHPKVNLDHVVGTINFLKIFVKFWKIFNVKTPDEGFVFNDPNRAVITSHTDPRFNFLREIAAMAKRMKPENDENRIKCLTSDTSKFLYHNCLAFIDLTKNLLDSGNKYVYYGWFSTDKLENTFGKLKQGSGRDYFLSARSGIEKVKINKSKLMLELKYDVLEHLNGEHVCNLCIQPVSVCEAEIIDNLELLEECIAEETFASLVYICSYVQELSNVTELDDTIEYYYHRYGTFLRSSDRCRRTIPHDSLVQWSCFCYMYFIQVEKVVCCKYIMDKFQYISEKYSFNVNQICCRVLSKIFLNKKILMSTQKK